MHKGTIFGDIYQQIRAAKPLPQKVYWCNVQNLCMLAGIYNCSCNTCLLQLSSGCFNLTTLDYFLEVYFRVWIPSLVCISTSAWSYIVLEIVAKASSTHSLWVHDPNHTHSLASFQWSGLSKQWALCLTKNCLQIRKWCPYKLYALWFIFTRTCNHCIAAEIYQYSTHSRKKASSPSQLVPTTSSVLLL